MGMAGEPGMGGGMPGMGGMGGYQQQMPTKIKASGTVTLTVFEAK